ncbi:MAG: Uma2 family endonuclease [Syntrophobacteraceae bacterium]
MSEPAKIQRYTYEDYRNFPDDLRCELIDGQIFDMAPAPSTNHQEIAGKIYHLARSFLESSGNNCRVFIAPVDVVLAEDQVVQPDVFLVCDRSKIHERGLFGAPDVVFEILSASTIKKDRTKKLDLYRRYGVSEYFLVDPDNEFIEKHEFLENRSEQRVHTFEGEQTLTIDTVGLEIVAKELFPV